MKLAWGPLYFGHGAPSPRLRHSSENCERTISGGTEAHNPAAAHSSQVLFRPGAGCYALSSGGELRGSRPAGTNGLNDDVVNDGADARRKFCSELGRFLLLDRVDKPP